jgi:hypothetical protein
MADSLKCINTQLNILCNYTKPSTSNMIGSRLYLLSAVVVLLSAVSSIAVVPRPQRDPTTGRKVGSNSSANNTYRAGTNMTIHNQSQLPMFFLFALGNFTDILIWFSHHRHQRWAGCM